MLRRVPVRTRVVAALALGSVAISALIAVATWNLTTGYMLQQREASVLRQATVNSRLVEEALIRVVRELGVPDAARVKGRSGVWLPADERRPERKVAAIGIRVAQGVTMHGFALNCDPDLTWFDRIVPCGIADAGVTSLTAELGRHITVRDVLEPTRRHLADLLGWTAYERVPDLEHLAEPEPAAIGTVSYGLAPLR